MSDQNPIESRIPKPDELRKLVEELSVWTTLCVRDQPQENWTPALAVMTVEAMCLKTRLEMMFLAVPFNADDEKQRALEVIGRNLAKSHRVPVAAVLATSAWKSRNPPPGMRPEDDPFRQDVIVVGGQAMSGFACLTHAPVMRVGNRLVLSEFEPVADGKMQLLENLFRGWMNGVREQRQRRISSAASPN